MWDTGFLLLSLELTVLGSQLGGSEVWATLPFILVVKATERQELVAEAPKILCSGKLGSGQIQTAEKQTAAVGAGAGVQFVIKLFLPLSSILLTFIC